MAMRHIDKSKDGYKVVEHGGVKYIEVYGDPERKIDEVRRKRKDRQAHKDGFDGMKAQEKKDLEVRNAAALARSHKEGEKEMEQLAAKREYDNNKIAMAHKEFTEKYSR